MTSKKHKQAIDAALSSALEPPRRRPSPQLDSVLSEYAAQSAEPPQPTPRTPPTPRTDATHPIAPARDFTRVANSVVRDVVPAGHFVGKSKQLYDCLYQRTRGAIIPVRKMTISKPALMKASGIGSERTLLKNLGHLKALGLVRVDYTDGKHEGNAYEVFLPEEVGLRGDQRTPPTPPTARTPLNAPHARVEVPPVPPVESGVRGVGSAPLNSTISGESKTSIKTNTIDDDEAAALSDLNLILVEAARKLVGCSPRTSEREQWAELARVIVEELNDAASRAESVSSVPAFLTAHLRRKLAPKPVARKREGNQKPDVDMPEALPPDPNRRLTEEEIAEQARVISEVIEGGYTLEQVEAQFGGSFNPEDWKLIREITQSQAAAKKGK